LKGVGCCGLGPGLGDLCLCCDMRVGTGDSCAGTGRPTDPDLGRTEEAADDLATADAAFVVWPLAIGDAVVVTLGAILGRPTDPERRFPSAMPDAGAFVG
jgi:hypothetical protein